MVFSGIFYLFAGALAVAALAMLVISYERGKRMALQAGFGELKDGLLSGYNRHVQDLKHVLALVSVFLLFTALAGPQFGTRFMKIKKTGVDVIIAVDISRSMLAEDVKPSRIEKAKSELAGLVDRLQGNRIGIVAFSGKAFLQCPLTLDTGAIKSILGMLDTELIPVPGTAIAEAVNVAREAFNRTERKYKALILLTDGEDHEGDVDKAVSEAKKDGIKIFTIGFGTPAGELIPERDSGGATTGYKKDKSGTVIATKLNEEALQKMALDSSGLYFRASDGEIETFRIAEQIDSFDKKDLRSQKFERYEQKFYYFALAAFILLFMEWLL